MRELFSADWYMLRKHGIIWWLCLCAFAIALFIVLAAAHSASEGYEIDFEIGPIGMGSMVAGAATALLCGVSFDNAFGEGTIRNKIVTGQSRAKVFWASYLTYTTAALVIFASYAVPLIIGTVAIAGPTDDMPQTLQVILYAICSIPAYTALYCAVSMIGGRKGVGIACLVAFVALAIVAVWLQQALAEPMMNNVYDLQVNTEYPANGDFESVEVAPQIIDTVPNPNYVAEPTRSVYTFFMNFLPTGQSLQLVTTIHAVLPWYALGFTALFSCIGAIVLRRRNIS